MGGRVIRGRIGSSPPYGGLPQKFSFASTPSTADQWRSVAFPGGLPPSVPAFIHGLDRTFPSDAYHYTSDGGSPHAPASLASTLASAAPSLRPLSHADMSGSFSSDLTMSAWPPPPVGVSPEVAVDVSPGVAVPVSVTRATPGVPVSGFPVSNGAHPSAHPAALPGATLSGMISGARVLAPAPDVAPMVGFDDDSTVSNVAPSPAPFPTVCPMEPFKLLPIADTKGFLNLSSILQYYLRRPEFSTLRSDGKLITDDRNAEASAYWEGQLRVAVQDGSLRFLFENKGSMYDGKGFEMLDALHRHCRPDTVANAFSTLMSLFNDSMGENEDIMAFRSRFDGMINEMSRYKIVIPNLLMVMFFLRSLHSRYSPLLDQCRSCARPFETASLDSIVSDVHFHDEFTVVGKDKKPKGPNAAAAAASPGTTPPSGALDKDGKPWNNPWEWLATVKPDSVKGRWKRALSGRGFCPICHRDGDRHAPVACPLLVELNLKLIKITPVGTGASPAPAAVPGPSPSPGGRSAVSDETSATGTSGSASARSGLVAMVAVADGDEYDSGDDFRWEGDESGFDFPGVARKSNNDVSVYPSCNHVVVEAIRPNIAPSPSAPSTTPSVNASRSITLPSSLASMISTMSKASILPGFGNSFTVADSGATDHMFPDKSAFISYKSISNLQVRMGNNSFLPVLGRGSAVIALNGQKILVRNVLHVPGLVVLLYSLRAHCTQRGCRFIGTSDVGILVYFPTFVLSVDTSKDCHLTFDSLGRSAPLALLDYIQPRCPPSLYPSERSSTTATTTTPLPHIVEDDSATSPISHDTVPSPSIPPVGSSLVISDGGTSTLSSISARLQSLTDAISILQARHGHTTVPAAPPILRDSPPGRCIHDVA